MADIIEVLLQHEVFHSDLKPENFVVLRHATDWRSHTLKIIDFGVSSINEFTNLLGRTPLYSEPGEGPRFFASRDERLLYEYYQFGRTL
jgi:serine/threonine protein kinase